MALILNINNGSFIPLRIVSTRVSLLPTVRKQHHKKPAWTYIALAPYRLTQYLVFSHMFIT